MDQVSPGVREEIARVVKPVRLLWRVGGDIPDG